MSDNSYTPTLSGLKAFVAVAQKNHFGSAATMLGVSQPSLSQALAAMEAGLGVQLVERSTRRVFLTAEGRDLLPRAQRAIDAVDDFVAAAAGAADPSSGTLQLGLIPTIAPYVLPTILSGVAAQMPQLTLRVVEDQTHRLLESLRLGEIDAAVLALPTEAPGTVEIPIYDEDFVLALPPGHAMSGRTQVHPDALAQLPLLLLDEGHCLRDQALEVCALAGVSPDVGHTRAASLSTAVQCVTGGLGVTLIPRTAVPVEERGGLGLAEFTAPRPGRRIGLVCRASRGSADFFETVAQMIGELVASTGLVHRIGR